MALNLNTLAQSVTDDKLDKKPGGAGRAPAIADEDNPFLGETGLLRQSYGDNNTAKSITVPNAEARELYGLINRSAAKMDLGVSVQFKGTNGQRLDYLNFAQEGAPADYKWAQANADGSDWEAYRGKTIRVIWKAKVRKQRKATDAAETAAE